MLRRSPRILDAPGRAGPQAGGAKRARTADPLPAKIVAPQPWRGPSLVTALFGPPRVTATPRLPLLDRARNGHATAVFKTELDCYPGWRLNWANGLRLLSGSFVIPRISRGAVPHSAPTCQCASWPIASSAMPSRRPGPSKRTSTVRLDG